MLCVSALGVCSIYLSNRFYTRRPEFRLAVPRRASALGSLSSSWCVYDVYELFICLFVCLLEPGGKGEPVHEQPVYEHSLFVCV